MTQELASPLKEKGGLRETAWVLLQAFLAAFVLRLFVLQPFTIPSGSMIPTLHIGDYIFVNKLSYGFGKHSFDFSIGLGDVRLYSFGPLPFSGRFFGAEPRRGDVVVFKLPRDPKIDYIKRVMGLPGDRIQILHGVVYLNGTPVRQDPMETYVGDVGQGQTEPVSARQYRETLPEGKTHPILDLASDDLLDNTQEFIVPQGHFFMMGDNRDNSADSRTEGVGFVPYENIVGKAELVFFSLDHTKGFFSVRFDRLFSWIR